MLRLCPAILALAVSLASLTSLAQADAGVGEAPDLRVRTDRRAPWTAYRVGADLLGIAFDRYVLDAEISFGRYHGGRLELGWQRGAGRGPLAGLAYEVWPQGRGVDGVYMAAGGRVAFALVRAWRVDGLLEVGYRHQWRGATIGASIGVAHRWTLEANGSTVVVPIGSIGVGWAF